MCHLLRNCCWGRGMLEDLDGSNTNLVPTHPQLHSRLAKLDVNQRSFSVGPKYHKGRDHSAFARPGLDIRIWGIFILGEVFIPRGILILGEVRGRYSERGNVLVHVE